MTPSDKQAILSAMKSSGATNPTEDSSKATNSPGNTSTGTLKLPEAFVDARVIARRYSVTSRHILQLAAEGRIPCTRLGPKCVRFLESEVAKILEG